LTKPDIAPPYGITALDFPTFGKTAGGSGHQATNKKSPLQKI